MAGSAFKLTVLGSKPRDNKLEMTLGDGYAEDVERLKQMIIDKAKPGPQKDSFLKRLEITPFVKKDISALLRGFGSYILYEFPLAFDNSLEYYKLVLKLHKFRKIEENMKREEAIEICREWGN